MSFKNGRRAKSGPDSQFGASSDCEGEGKASIPSMYAQRLCMGPIQSCLNILMTKMI